MFKLSNVQNRITGVIQNLRQINPSCKYESRVIGEAMTLLLLLNDILENNTTTKGDNNE